MRFELNKTLTPAAFVADVDPNTTEPAATLVTPVNQGMRGHAVSMHFFEADGTTMVPGATADFTTWVKDVGTEGRWHALDPEAAAANSALFKAAASGEVLIQVTSVGTIGLAKFLKVIVAQREYV